MTTFTRWLPAITQTVSVGKGAVIRKGALGIAGLAFVGGAVAGPATAVEAAPQSMQPVAAVQQTEKPKGSTAKGVEFEYEEQPNGYFCGPASTRIALSAQGETPSQDEMAKKLGTTIAGTDSALDITRVLNETIGEDVYKTTEIPNQSASKDEAQRMKVDLKNAIDNKRVPVVNIIGSATDADGGQHSFAVGHYLAVVGYDADGDKVRIADPWQPVGDGTYWMSTSDLANWAASRGYSA